MVSVDHTIEPEQIPETHPGADSNTPSSGRREEVLQRIKTDALEDIESVLSESPGVPESFHRCIQVLNQISESRKNTSQKSPIDFQKARLEAAESATEELAGNKLDLQDPTVEEKLSRALMSLRFSSKKDHIQDILERPDFDSEIFPLLVMMERIINRCPGAVEKFERASAHIKGKRQFVSTEIIPNAIELRVDIEGSSKTRAELGAEKTYVKLIRNLFQEYIFPVLRCFPEVRLVEVAGDEGLCLARVEDAMPAFQYAVTLANQLIKKAQLSAHIGISIGPAYFTITPQGNFLIEGPARRQAESARVASKLKKETEGIYDPGENLGIYVHTKEGQNRPLTEMNDKRIDWTMGLEEAKKPDHRAIQLGKLIEGRGVSEKDYVQSEQLIKDLKTAAALLMSTIADGIFETEETQFTETVVVYGKPNMDTIYAVEERHLKPGMDLKEAEIALQKAWEEIAAKVAAAKKIWGGALNYLTSEGVILFFGATGSSPIGQAAHGVQCAMSLVDNGILNKAAITKGEVLTGRMGENGMMGSSEIDLASRFAHLKLDVDGKILLSPRVEEGLIREGIRPKRQELKIEVRGFGERKVIVCDGLEMEEIKNLPFYEEELKEVKTLLAECRIHPGVYTIQLQGNLEMGTPEFLTKIWKTGREMGFTTTELEVDQFNQKPYGFIGSILRGLFENEKEFERWARSAYAQTYADESIAPLWVKIFREVVMNEGAGSSALQDEEIIETNLRQIIEAISIQNPLQVMGGSWERMDIGSRKIFETLIQSQTPESRMMIIWVQESQSSDSLESHEKETQIELKGITPESAYKAIAILCERPNAKMDEEVKKFYQDTLEGDRWSPFLVENLTRELIAKGQIRFDETQGTIGFSETRPEVSTASLKEFTQAQYEHLDSLSQEVFKIACVLGTPGKTRTLKALCREKLNQEIDLKSLGNILKVDETNGNYKIVPSFLVKTVRKIYLPLNMEETLRNEILETLSHSPEADLETLMQQAIQAQKPQKGSIRVEKELTHCMDEKKFLEAYFLSSRFMKECLDKIQEGTREELEAALRIGLQRIEILIQLNKDHELHSKSRKDQTEGDIEKIGKFVGKHKEDLQGNSDLMKQYYFKLCESAYIKKDIQQMEAQLQKLEELGEMDEETQSLIMYYRAAQLYRRAHKETGEPSKAKETIREGQELIEQLRNRGRSETLERNSERMALMLEQVEKVVLPSYKGSLNEINLTAEEKAGIREIQKKLKAYQKKYRASLSKRDEQSLNRGIWHCSSLLGEDIENNILDVIAENESTGSIEGTISTQFDLLSYFIDQIEHPEVEGGRKQGVAQKAQALETNLKPQIRYLGEKLRGAFLTNQVGLRNAVKALDAAA